MLQIEKRQIYEKNSNTKAQELPKLVEGYVAFTLTYQSDMGKLVKYVLSYIILIFTYTLNCLEIQPPTCDAEYELSALQF